MLLTILGASAATQNPGGACSSYLVRHRSTAIVVDMGNGALANLQRFVRPGEVDAVLISHVHADHTLDLIPYRYWLEFSRTPRRPRLFLPPDGHRKLLNVIAMQDPSATFYQDVFDVQEYEPAGLLQIGEIQVSFEAVHHAPHSYGMRLRGDGVLAYSADSGPVESLAALAHDADLFLCENSNSVAASSEFHLAPRQAGEYARDGGAKRLVLTHRWHEHDLDGAVREAASAYDGPISVAREGDTYVVRHVQVKA